MGEPTPEELEAEKLRNALHAIADASDLTVSGILIDIAKEALK